MNQIIEVLIIEDDFWIAGIHKDIVENIQPFRVTHIAKSAEEAVRFLEGCEQLPQLVLLDLYIPDTEGLTLFNNLKARYPSIDIIVVSAANDRKTIVETKRAGAFDFIIKPVDQQRFNQSLHAYVEFRKRIDGPGPFKQQEVDRLFRMMSGENKIERETGELPKGIDPLTLQEIIGYLENQATGPMTATAISDALGMSRSTVRRYMEYLVATEQVEAVQHYGNVGRPLRQYIYREQNEQNAGNR